MQKHRQIGGVSVWAWHFSAGEKKPAEAGFSQDHYRLPVGSDPCIGRSSMILKHSLCFS